MSTDKTEKPDRFKQWLLGVTAAAAPASMLAGQLTAVHQEAARYDISNVVGLLVMAAVGSLAADKAASWNKPVLAVTALLAMTTGVGFFGYATAKNNLVSTKAAAHIAKADLAPLCEEATKAHPGYPIVFSNGGDKYKCPFSPPPAIQLPFAQRVCADAVGKDGKPAHQVEVRVEDPQYSGGYHDALVACPPRP